MTMNDEDAQRTQAKASDAAGRTDQEVFDEQVARAMGKVVLYSGGLAILAALVMSTIALVKSSSNDHGTSATVTQTVTVHAKAPAATGGVAATGQSATDTIGRQLFVSGDPGAGVIACGSCHTMAAAGAVATVGPNLDKELTADPPSAARTSIVDPNKEIAKGYAANIMPTNYGTALSKARLDALVNYVYQSTNTKAKAKAG